jgi:predicted nucleotidyltransferase
MKTAPKITRRQLPEPVRKPVTELTLALRTLLGPHLEQVILFGSYARGEAQPPDSDLDVLLVLRDGFDFWATDRLVSPIFAELSLKYDLVFSRKLVSQAHYATSQMPFVANVRNEGIAV